MRTYANRCVGHALLSLKLCQRRHGSSHKLPTPSAQYVFVAESLKFGMVDLALAKLCEGTEALFAEVETSRTAPTSNVQLTLEEVRLLAEDFLVVLKTSEPLNLASIEKVVELQKRLDTVSKMCPDSSKVTNDDGNQLANNHQGTIAHFDRKTTIVPHRVAKRKPHPPGTSSSPSTAEEPKTYSPTFELHKMLDDIGNRLAQYMDQFKAYNAISPFLGGGGEQPLSAGWKGKSQSEDTNKHNSVDGARFLRLQQQLVMDKFPLLIEEMRWEWLTALGLFSRLFCGDKKGSPGAAPHPVTYAKLLRICSVSVPPPLRLTLPEEIIGAQEQHLSDHQSTSLSIDLGARAKRWSYEDADEKRAVKEKLEGLRHIINAMDASKDSNGDIQNDYVRHYDTVGFPWREQRESLPNSLQAEDATGSLISALLSPWIRSPLKAAQSPYDDTEELTAHQKPEEPSTSESSEEKNTKRFLTPIVPPRTQNGYTTKKLEAMIRHQGSARHGVAQQHFHSWIRTLAKELSEKTVDVEIAVNTIPFIPLSPLLLSVPLCGTAFDDLERPQSARREDGSIISIAAKGALAILRGGSTRHTPHVVAWSALLPTDWWLSPEDRCLRILHDYCCRWETLMAGDGNTAPLLDSNVVKMLSSFVKEEYENGTSNFTKSDPPANKMLSTTAFDHLSYDTEVKGRLESLLKFRPTKALLIAVAEAANALGSAKLGRVLLEGRAFRGRLLLSEVSDPVIPSLIEGASIDRSMLPPPPPIPWYDLNTLQALDLLEWSSNKRFAEVSGTEVPSLTSLCGSTIRTRQLFPSVVRLGAMALSARGQWATIATAFNTMQRAAGLNTPEAILSTPFAEDIGVHPTADLATSTSASFEQLYDVLGAAQVVFHLNTCSYIATCIALGESFAKNRLKKQAKLLKAQITDCSELLEGRNFESVAERCSKMKEKISVVGRLVVLVPSSDERETLARGVQVMKDKFNNLVHDQLARFESDNGSEGAEAALLRGMDANQRNAAQKARSGDAEFNSRSNRAHVGVEVLSPTSPTFSHWRYALKVISDASAFDRSAAVVAALNAMRAGGHWGPALNITARLYHPAIYENARTVQQKNTKLKVALGKQNSVTYAVYRDLGLPSITNKSQKWGGLSVDAAMTVSSVILHEESYKWIPKHLVRLLRHWFATQEPLNVRLADDGFAESNKGTPFRRGVNTTLLAHGSQSYFAHDHSTPIIRAAPDSEVSVAVPSISKSPLQNFTRRTQR